MTDLTETAAMWLLPSKLYRKSQHKKEGPSQLEDFCAPETVIASNTSALDIFSIAEVKIPKRLIISHFFAPAHIIPLVEIVPGARLHRNRVVHRIPHGEAWQESGSDEKVLAGLHWQPNPEGDR